MPITKSAKKALRQSERRRVRNQARKAALKSALKKIDKLIASKKTAELSEALRHAYKIIDKSAKHHLIHKNKAARLKSHLATRCQNMRAQ